MKTIIEVNEDDLSGTYKNTCLKNIKIEHLKALPFKAACLADIVIFDNNITRIVLKDRT